MPAIRSGTRCLLLLIVATLMLVPSHPGLAGTTASPLRIGVLEFVNTSPERELDPLGRGLQYMITTDLTQVGAVQIVERARLHELQQEIARSRSKLFDPATAVKLGKLSGATHLLDGSFVVVGDRMRIDCQLLSVESGAVILAAKDEGERDAFFELQKQLVRRLLDALGAQLGPKQRAQLSQIQTTDFAAFQLFSRGIAMGDDKYYTEAIASLQAAVTRDQDFKLAVTASSDYEQLLNKLHLQEAELDASEDAVVKRLVTIAQQPGAQNKTRRLVALFLLAVAHGGGLACSQADGGFGGRYPLKAENWGKVYQYNRMDRFAMFRAADLYAAQYWKESAELLPNVLPVVIQDETLESINMPTSIRTFDKEFEQAVAEFTRTKDVHEVVKALVSDQADGSNYMLRQAPCFIPHLHPAGAHQWADALFALYKRVKTIRAALHLPAGEVEEKWLGKLALFYANALDFERSTQLLAERANWVKARNGPSSLLHSIGVQIERNHEVQRLLPSASPAVRESMLLDPLYGHSQLELLRGTKRLEPSELERLRWMQISLMLQWTDVIFPGGVYLGGHQAWAIQSRSYLWTGPRSDVARTEELRYHHEGEENSRDIDPLIIVDGLPAADVGAAFVIQLKVPDHFGLRPITKPPEQAKVGWLFGVREIDHHTKPTTGWALWIEPTSVRVSRLVELSHPRISNADWRKPGWGKLLRWDTVQEQTIPATTATTRTVAVRIAGAQIIATIDGTKYAFPAPADRAGFYGLAFHGAGYAAVSDLKLTAP